MPSYNFANLLSNGGTTMAKNKKSPPKAGKKTKSAKPAAKNRKPASAKAKKVVAKKAKHTPKKAKVKKVAKAISKPTATKPTATKPTVTKPAATKPVASKPTAPKATPKKALEKKVIARKVSVAPKKSSQPSPPEISNAQASSAAKIAAAAQLNFFQMPNQRPMAHKPAKSSSAPADNKTRYSDEELKEFQVLINRKLDKAREEYKILKETLNRNNDEGTDATSGGNTKVLEDGAETAEKENLSQLAARQQKYITNLENALVRIKNGTYGICSVTGKLISKERLIAVPHTTQSIEAKLMQQD